MRLKTLWRALIAVCVTAALALSGLSAIGVSASAASEAKTVASEPQAATAHATVLGAGHLGESSGEFLSGSSESLIFAGKVFSHLKLGDTLLKWSYGLGMISAIVAPLLTYFLGGDEGPTTQDVLDKLDEMTKQLDAIQGQLTAIQAQIKALDSDVLTGTCSTLQSSLNGDAAAIQGVTTKYEQVLTAVDDLAAAGQTGSTVDPKAQSEAVNQLFAEFATQVMGSSSTAGAGGLSDMITAIHNQLVTPQSGSGEGIIQACERSELANFQAAVTHQPGLGFVDDRTYYQPTINLVRYYETLESEALTFVEEAAYFRANQELLSHHVSIPTDSGASVCATAASNREGALANETCKSVNSLVKTVYANFVDEWTLAGRPYTDGHVVLQIPSSVSGVQPVGGASPPLLLASDPSSAPASVSKGTWSSKPAADVSYAGFTGWKAADLSQWQSLERTEASTTGACDPTGSGVSHVPNVLCALEARTYTPPGGSAEHVFTAPKSGYFWLAGSSLPGQKLPIPPNATVLLDFGVRTAYSFGGPDLNIRCLVYANPAAATQSNCDPNWLSNATIATYSAQDEHTDHSAHYTITWGFRPGSFPGAAEPTFRYEFYDPSRAAGIYRSDNSTYLAWINQAPLAAFPAIFDKISIPETTFSHQGFGYYYPHIQWVDHAPSDVEEMMLPTWKVPTGAPNSDCTNGAGEPKLCTEDTKEAPHQADAFHHWVNNSIPNPSLPSPTPKGQPSMHQAGGATTCDSAGWEDAPANWPYGKVERLATTWTGTAGATTFTQTTAGKSLDDAAFVEAGKFESGAAIQLTCQVSARWEDLANAGEALSPTYQITPTKAKNYVLTRQPAPPTIEKAVAGSRSATIDFTVGNSYGEPVTSFTVTPLLDGVVTAPVTVAAGGHGLSPSQGAHDHVEITGLKNDGHYRFSVANNVLAHGTSTLVPGRASAPSNEVTPGSSQPLTPLTPGSTTTTIPDGPTTTTTPDHPSGPEHSVSTIDGSKALVALTLPGEPSVVDLEFTSPHRDGGNQQSVAMMREGNGWHYVYTIEGLVPHATVTYWFKYQFVNESGRPFHFTEHFTHTQMSDPSGGQG